MILTVIDERNRCAPGRVAHKRRQARCIYDWQLPLPGAVVRCTMGLDGSLTLAYALLGILAFIVWKVTAGSPFRNLPGPPSPSFLKGPFRLLVLVHSIHTEPACRRELAAVLQ